MSTKLKDLENATNAMLAKRPIMPELDAQRMKSKGTLLRNSEKDSGEVELFTERSHACVESLITALWDRLPILRP